MTVRYEGFRKLVERLHQDGELSFQTTAMFLMTVGVMGMARSLPVSLRPALADAVARWFAGGGERSLEPSRMACWRFLEGRTGDSTTMADETDLAVRALICVLWDDDSPGGDIDATLAFFADLAERYGGLERSLGL